MNNNSRVDPLSLAAGAFAVLAASLLLQRLGLMERWIECIFFLSLP